MSAGHIDFAAINQAAAGRWGEIFAALTPLPSDVVTKGKEDHPCPNCNGQSTLWPDGRDGGANHHGRLACRTCTDNKQTGDGIATVAAFTKQNQGDAAKCIAEYLGLRMNAGSPPEPLDVIELVAKAKRMPVEAFRKFEPEAVKAGRSPKKEVARVPVYNAKGERHSYFDLSPNDKGKFARGEGMSGMFFPGRLPKPGETWHLVEGVKDAAALVGLGYNAAGLPNSQMADKYARLFKGTNVIFVPDLDSAGQNGAQKSGGRLHRIAASVRVARLPGEIVAKGGADVRDILRGTDGEANVREAIETAEQWQPRIVEEDERGPHQADDGAPLPSRSTRVCPCTDLGNAERFADQHSSRAKYCFQTGQWFAWKGTHWQPDSDGEVYRLASRTVRNIYREVAATDDDALRERLAKWAKASESKARIDAMLFLARSRPGVSVAVDALDSQHMLFNCLSGTLDLETRRHRKHDPGNLITRCAPVRFDPKAKAPLWDKFLARIFADDDDLITFVQRVLGMTLTGDVREQFLFIFHGAGANGKSVLLDTITRLLGDYAGAAAPELLVAKKHGEHPTELADLQGKRAVIASEVESGATWRLQLIKRLTGDATIKARKMRQDFYEFPRTHKLLVVTNTKPRVNEDSEAVWRRLRLIPFSVVIPPAERDPHLLAKLTEESSGILNWLLAGCTDWQQHGLTEPSAVVEATGDYRAESDPLRDFISDRCELDPEAWTSNADLRQAYEAHCVENGSKPLGKMRFADALGRHGCHGKRTPQSRGWQGVALTDDPAMTTHDDPTRFPHRNMPYEKQTGTVVIGRHADMQDSFFGPSESTSDEQSEPAWNGETSSAKPTSRPCPRCGAKLVIRSEPVNGWQNLDCLTPGCGHVQPSKLAEAGAAK